MSLTGLHILQTCRSSSIFGMFLIDTCNKVMQSQGTSVRQLRVVLQEEWGNIPQATINNPVMSMRRRCTTLCDANGGHTGY